MIDPTLPTVDDLRPDLAKLAEHGGAVIVGITTNPRRQNFATVSWQHFDAEETKALRRAVTNVRKQRSVSHLPDEQNAIAANAAQMKGAA